MTKLPLCRLLLEPEPQSGARNMAIDEVLLETAVSEGLATFRWYRWAEPTLSLGYFQSVPEVDADPGFSSLPKVRRLTGGGAILHDQEWTYSLALPAQSRLFQRPEELYDLVHGALIELLRGHGCPAEFRGETHQLSPEPVLCFSRRDAHDVVLQGHKIIGSAQRRRKGAVLQHGSLLLRRSTLAPEQPGIEDLGCRETITPDDLRRLPEHWFTRVILGNLTIDEVGRIGWLMDERNIAPDGR